MNNINFLTQFDEENNSNAAINGYKMLWAENGENLSQIYAGTGAVSR